MNAKSRLLVVALLVSVALNVATAGLVVVWAAKKGGVRYVGEQLGWVRTVHRATDWQEDWAARNKTLPNLPGEIVFLGDSITASMPWGEYFSFLRNRGIGGDTADGILQRLDEITESAPKQVFVNIGTNDLAKETPVEQVVDDIEEIVRRIDASSPATEVFVCSVLPINLDFQKDVRTEWKQEAISKVNAALRDGEKERGFQFIDLTPVFADSRGFLREELTTDGLHLNDHGKEAYCRHLTHYVKSEAAALLDGDARISAVSVSSPGSRAPLVSAQTGRDDAAAEATD